MAVVEEGHALTLEHDALRAGRAVVIASPEVAVLVHHAVAGDGAWLKRGMHGVAHKKGLARLPDGAGDVAVGGYVSLRNLPDDLVYLVVECAHGRTSSSLT